MPPVLSYLCYEGMAVTMTIREAEMIAKKYGSKTQLSEAEEFTYIEALEYLIKETGDTGWMCALGGYYYGKKDYILARKYYEMADEGGDEWAPEGLGYIWYYGRCGEVDYEKAFHYYSKAAENGLLQSEIKLADMYKNGYFVEQDYDEYCRIIEKAYKSVPVMYNPYQPISEICVRMAGIRKKQGRISEAIEAYEKAREILGTRIRNSGFFGDINSMKWLIEDLYTMKEIDYSDLDLFDLFWIMQYPAKVSFMYRDKKYEVTGVKEENGIAIFFDGHWYRSVTEFFNEAMLEGHRITDNWTRLYNMEVHYERTDQSKE